MRVSRPAHRAVSLLGVSIALVACSGGLSAQSPRPTQIAQAPASAPATSTEGLVRSLPDFSPLVEKYGPAVVNVEVVEKAQSANGGGVPGLSPNDPFFDFFRRFGIPGPDQAPRGNQPPVRGAGSGFIVSSDGYILTNTHVVANADEVTVRLTDRREFPAKVIGADERTDVAVIKINAANLPTVRLGDAEDQARPVGACDRFAVRLREQRHRRHHQRDLALAAERQLRAVHPDRCGGESRQLRGPAVQLVG
jgi:serine protease Do